MHRFILAEMNTHRAFSRNSASSRAIPSAKIRERVMTDTAYPVYWGSEQRGMQAGAELDPEQIEMCKAGWESARDKAVRCADVLANSYDLHKSLVNRLVEPFMWHTAIISATEWDNFFWQRCHKDAQPEMKAVADEMQRAYYTSEPRRLVHGEWHMPYIDRDAIEQNFKRDEVRDAFKSSDYGIQALKRISVARCARVSYLTQDGKRDIEEDLSLYGRLKTSGHWSPFEHVATPAANHEPSNFVGWKQFRKEFRDENRTRFVPNLPDLAHVTMKLEAAFGQMK